jgi:hypothetical protein
LLELAVALASTDRPPARAAGEGGMRGSLRRLLAAIMAWVRRQPPKVKAFLAVFIRFIVHDHDNLFVAAEAAHAIGIGVLIYKLTKEKTYAGSSVRPSPFFYFSSQLLLPIRSIRRPR